MDDIDPTPTPILSYSRSRPRRWPRLLILSALLLSLAITALYTYRHVAVWYARRQGLRQTRAWYQLARTFTLPPDTLLYSEHPDDFVGRRPVSAFRGTTLSYQYVSFDARHPALRQVGYTAAGVPIPHEFHVVYAHEHLAWDTASPTGSSPQLIIASYHGPNPDGSPGFSVMSYHPPTRLPLVFNGGTCSTTSPPTRPLTRLRLYAGQPHPTDPARFSIPFSCDTGAGHFDFQLDTNPSDGGRLTPTVLLRWDPPPSTNPSH